MKKLIRLILMLLPAFAFSNTPVSITEQKYLSALAKSFNDTKTMAPRTPLYWSLCLGETEALSTKQLANRITALSADSAARIAFYKRLNCYRSFRASLEQWTPTYDPILLPVEIKIKKRSAKGPKLIQVLSFDEPEITDEDWQAYTDYVTAYGEDAELSAHWFGCDNKAGDNNVNDQVKIYTFVESNPVFPGGDGELARFLQAQLRYPEMEAEKNITGKVIVRLVVCPDGRVSAGAIKRGVSPGIDHEALLMLKMLPPFIAGTQGGVKVPVYFNLPIVYKLQ